jgi:hypothetical protein
MKNVAIITLLCIAVAFIFVPAVNAATVSNVTIVRISGYSGTSSHFIYFRSGGLDNTYNYCTTSDDTLAIIATQAMSGPANVQISTSATCDTSTNSSCGTCSIIRINP